MIIPATYNKDNIPSRFVGNPLVEALPRIVSPIALLKLLALKPQHDLAESKSKPAYIRIYDVLCLLELFVPPPIAMEFCIALDQVLMNSYGERHPFARDTQAWLHTPEDMMRMQGAARDTLQGMLFLIGGSGQGKTRLIRVCLSRYPQCIVHICYGQREFNQKQVVWISVEVPSTGSFKTLMHRLFSALDEALGQPGAPESYVVEHADSSVETMLQKFADAAKNHFLGVLHIDDLQRSIEVHSGKAIVKFIIQLASVVRCPVIFSATDEVQGLFDDMRKFESARRAIKEGSYSLQRATSADDPFFVRLFDEVMKWQWTDVPITPDAGLRKLLFKMSVGITALFMFLHTKAQTRALMLGGAAFKVEHYYHVYRHGLRPLRPLLQKIRNGQPPANDALEEFFKEQMAA